MAKNAARYRGCLSLARERRKQTQTSPPVRRLSEPRRVCLTENKLQPGLRRLGQIEIRPLKVLWENAPAHHGDALRAYLATPGLYLRLVSLPGYNPDFTADEAIWDRALEEVTANLCLGTNAAVEDKIGALLRPTGLANGRGQAMVSDRPASATRGPPEADHSQFL